MAFRSGARGGLNAVPMKMVTSKLGDAQIVDLAAYIASLRP
jgi:cytochrome c553